MHPSTHFSPALGDVIPGLWNHPHIQMSHILPVSAWGPVPAGSFDRDCYKTSMLADGFEDCDPKSSIFRSASFNISPPSPEPRAKRGVESQSRDGDLVAVLDSFKDTSRVPTGSQRVTQ